ncbi:MAG: hypothetical protein KIC94_04495 [Clostridiales bacterium]|nr:hypothetical protein [Clostridiales bacterium]
MEFQPSQQDVNELINVMFHDELQYFNASFDIVKNEVIPSITQSLESLQRAEQEYRNGQGIRETRIDTINENADNVTSNYFTPACWALQKKISKYYEFVNEEYEQLLLSLNAASASAQNMITFQTVWQRYENQLQDCISNATDNLQQEESQTP